MTSTAATVSLPAPFYEDGAVQIYHGDCLELLPALGDLAGRLAHVITDPPYRRHVGDALPGKMGKLRDGKERIRDLGYGDLAQEMIDGCAVHFSGAGRWILVFSDVESSGDWRRALVGEDFRYVRTGAWVRENTTPQFSGDRPAVGFEAITICHSKACRLKWNGGGLPAVWRYPIVHASSSERAGGHTTPKPLALMRKLIEQFTDPGELILDPFAGSGTTLRAAKDCGRRALGIEISEEYCEVAARRMAQEVLPL
jgi:site-specific DNA-methyltransferase (adenine-specific)